MDCRNVKRERFENRLETSTRLFEIEDGDEVHENFHESIKRFHDEIFMNSSPQQNVYIVLGHMI